MKFWKQLCCLGLAAVAMLSVAGCGGSSPESSSSGKMQKLSIGLMPDTDSLPFLIAEEKGYFADEGLEVDLKQFKSAMDRDSALQSGNLDGAVSDMLAAAFAKDGGFDVKVTSATDGSYKLVAGKTEGAVDVKGLQGKDVSVSRNTIIEYVTDEILAKDGLKGEDINKVIIPQIPTRLEMASIAIHNGAHLVKSSDDLGINPGIILFTDKAAKDKQKEIQAMYRAYNRAVDYLNTAPREDYIDFVIEKAGFPAAAKEALKLPTYHKAALPKEQDVTDCIKWLNAKDLVKETYGYDDLVIKLLGE